MADPTVEIYCEGVKFGVKSGCEEIAPSLVPAFISARIRDRPGSDFSGRFNRKIYPRYSGSVPPDRISEI